MKELIQTWDRETTLTFISMLVAAYAWITTEKLLVGIAVGIAMHALQVALYESFATRLSWNSLEIALFFRKHALPHFARIRTTRIRA